MSATRYVIKSGRYYYAGAVVCSGGVRHENQWNDRAHATVYFDKDEAKTRLAFCRKEMAHNARLVRLVGMADLRARIAVLKAMIADLTTNPAEG